MGAAAHLAGAALGAAAASVHTNAATSNAYNAGYTAGAASAGAVPINYTMNEIVAMLPAGCINPNVNNKSYYLCGNTWFQPSYGANGLY